MNRVSRHIVHSSSSGIHMGALRFVLVFSQIISIASAAVLPSTAQAAKLNRPAAQIAGTSVLTVTKVVNNNGQPPIPGQVFTYTITGPSYPAGSGPLTIQGGQSNVYNVLPGSYTVAEQTPLGWGATYAATPGSTTSNSAIVSLTGVGLPPTSNGPITGQVFRDFNSDGSISAGESGLSGVTVTAYNLAGVACSTTTTDAAGNYTLSTFGVCVAVSDRVYQFAGGV